MTAVSSVKDKPKIRPLGNKMLVLPDPFVEKQIRGIFIPATATSPLEQATVVLISTDTPMHIKEGERFLMMRGAGVEHVFDDVAYRFINGPTDTMAGDVVAII